HQILQGTAQLALVYVPVSQTAVVVIPFSKPTIVQNQHIKTQLSSPVSDGKKLKGIKIEIGGFPVVHKGRTFFIFPGTADQVVHIGFVESGREICKSKGRIGEHDLGSDKTFALFQIPDKLIV